MSSGSDFTCRGLKKKESFEPKILTLSSTKPGEKRRKDSPGKPVFFFQPDFTVEGLDLKLVRQLKAEGEYCNCRH